MSWSQYLRNLGLRHRLTMLRTAGPGPLDYRTNLLLGVTCALAALLLVAVGGYRFGFETIHGFGRRIPATALQVLTCSGDTLLSICLVALFARRQPRVVWLAAIAGVYATVFSTGIKNLVQAARPHLVLGPSLAVIGPELHVQSFPSGHTVTAFVTAACFSVGAGLGARVLFYVLALAVGASRVWVGAHWPVDVIEGAAVAGLSVALAMRTFRATPWGLGLVPHLSFVGLVAAAAVAELIRGPVYPLALPLTISVAVLSLFTLAKDYVFEPLLRGVEATRKPET